MTVNATNISDSYVGNGVNLNFPITFEYTDIPSIKVYVDDVLQNLGGDYAYDNALAPTAIVFSVAPALAADVEIKRESDLVQNTDLNINETYSSRAESIEDQFDRVVQIAQELQDKINELGAPVTNTVVASVPFPSWNTSTEYVAGQAVRFSGTQYVALVDHTSDNSNFLTDLGNGRWEKLEEGATGATGATGAQGPVGPAGANGANGANGADGNDGIFSQIANVSDAQNGTENTKGMTALRTAEAIAFQVPNLTVVTDLQSSIGSLNSALGELGTRLSAVENSLQNNLGKFSGSQQLDNNVTTPIELLGSGIGATGVGFKLAVDDTGAEFANIQIYIRRTSDGNTVRFSSFKINMHFVNGTWYMMREETFVLEETLEVDGVTLSINTDANGVGQISYVSDNIPGVYEPKQSYIAWVGQEITKGSLPC